MRWIVVAYRAPQQPSTARAAAWRLLKGAGGLYVQQSVCLLPDTPRTRETVDRVRAFIEAAEGAATLLEIEEMSDESEKLVRAQFNELRDAEYRELIERCEGFEAELRKEVGRGNLTFAEVEENDDDLVKLRAWSRKIRARDFFGARGAAAAEAAVDRCAARLEEFTDRVLRREGVVERRSPSPTKRHPRDVRR